jgi:hypothetical protein
MKGALETRKRTGTATKSGYNEALSQGGSVRTKLRQKRFKTLSCDPVAAPRASGGGILQLRELSKAISATDEAGVYFKVVNGHGPKQQRA